MTLEQEKPAFTEDDVANDFTEEIDYHVMHELGRGELRPYEYVPADDEDGGWPFTVLRDGREFEVDIDVRVTELTPEVKAKREADMRELKACLDRIAPLSSGPGDVGEGS